MSVTPGIAASERIDVMFHAHDLGLGHVSRGMTILASLANRRPGSRLMLVSGSPFVQSLSFPEVDWVKLPSYGTIVAGGQIHAVNGPGGLSLNSTQRLRSRMLADLVAESRPRIVVVDHRPKGQHDELLAALAASDPDTRWILGMRAIVGNVEGVWTEEASAVFRRHYDEMFWYGDSRIVGAGAIDGLASHFGTQPRELGYVSRAAFLSAVGAVEVADHKAHTGVLSVTWFSRETLTFLEEFLQAVRSRMTGIDQWHCFLGGGEDGDRKQRIVDGLSESTTVHPVSDAMRYLGLLASAGVAVIYAGYNSLLDVIWAGVPTLAVTRHLENREQVAHAALVSRSVEGLTVIEERDVTAAAIRAEIGLLSGRTLHANDFPIDGGLRTASALAALLDA